MLQYRHAIFVSWQKGIGNRVNRLIGAERHSEHKIVHSMKPIKYSQDKATVISLGTKIIYKFPTQTKLFDLARMAVNGRHPENFKEFILESDCHFVIYVIKGRGKIYAGEEIFSVSVGDVVDVPPRNKFACEGKGLEYITFDVPAFYPEQSEIITEK